MLGYRNPAGAAVLNGILLLPQPTVTMVATHVASYLKAWHATRQ